VNGIRQSSSDQNSSGPSVKAKLSRFRGSLKSATTGGFSIGAYRVAPAPDWQPPERVTKVETPRQTVAMKRLEKLAEETHVRNPQFTKEQAFSKILETSEGQTLYREDRNERLGIAVA
jgi:hypothetical protein